MGVFAIMLVESELPGSSIQPIKTVFVPDPKESVAVRLYGPDHVVVQAVGLFEGRLNTPPSRSNSAPFRLSASIAFFVQGGVAWRPANRLH